VALPVRLDHSTRHELVVGADQAALCRLPVSGMQVKPKNGAGRAGSTQSQVIHARSGARAGGR
jgi:hypothetical protein